MAAGGTDCFPWLVGSGSAENLAWHQGKCWPASHLTKDCGNGLGLSTSLPLLLDQEEDCWFCLQLFTALSFLASRPGQGVH